MNITSLFDMNEDTVMTIMRSSYNGITWDSDRLKLVKVKNKLMADQEVNHNDFITLKNCFDNESLLRYFLFYLNREQSKLILDIFGNGVTICGTINNERVELC